MEFVIALMVGLICGMFIGGYARPGSFPSIWAAAMAGSFSTIGVADGSAFMIRLFCGCLTLLGLLLGAMVGSWFLKEWFDSFRPKTII